MKVILFAACLCIAGTLSALAAGTHPLRRGEIAADPRTIASITQGPDMITRAGSSQKAARADLDSNNIAIAGTVTAMWWRKNRSH
jgi:hypothetical protein